MGDESWQYWNGVDATTNIDIVALVSSVERTMCRPLNMYSKACIFKTPEILSRHNNKAYLPIAFSIGPFHHGQPQLVATQEIKLYYLQGLFCRAPTAHTNLWDLIKAVAELEGHARASYAASVTLTKQEFTEMLLFDGCFLIELLRKNYGVVSVEDDDPVLKVSSMRQCLYHDLVLLENQIPWFVLETLFCLTNDYDVTLIQMVAQFLRCVHSPSSIPPAIPTSPCGHILYMLRETLILSAIEVDFETGDDTFSFDSSTFPSATSLVDAGIKLRKLASKDGSSSSILDIKFDKANGVLQISPFLIHDTTEATFRNLISFEQCFSGCKPVITSYLMLLDDLIDTSKDLKILRDKGIVRNCWLDAEDATRIFNGIYTDCYVQNFHYTSLCKEVNTYCKRKWPKWRAIYMRNYFGTPWAIASQVVAALVLIFTFLQTFFTVLG